jgi:hypothetical protein
MDEDLALRRHQEGLADAAEVGGLDAVDQGVEREIAAEHADQLAVGRNRHTGGNDQLLGAVVEVGFGQLG